MANFTQQFPYYQVYSRPLFAAADVLDTWIVFYGDPSTSSEVLLQAPAEKQTQH